MNFYSYCSLVLALQYQGFVGALILREVDSPLHDFSHIGAVEARGPMAGC